MQGRTDQLQGILPFSLFSFFFSVVSNSFSLVILPFPQELREDLIVKFA